MMRKLASICVYGVSGIILFLAVYLFAIPAGILVHDLRDPALYTGEIPRFAFRWHRALSQEYEPWAVERVASRKATDLSTYNIPGTEWPIFSSVFYLWATEALQDAWEKDPTLAPIMPTEYAQGAIEAAASLVADPNHATWVKDYWGDDYLERENLFYRMLLISGLTSYQKLLGDDTYQALLSEQVDSLAREIDESPFGLLDDYPGQCYPIDVMPAIAAIQRSDEVLGTDHSAFVDRALRAFEGDRLDERTQLPAYKASSRTGRGLGPARGVGISFMLIWVPELWPETARQWYTSYEEHFWQSGQMLAGFRELAKDFPSADWFADVDAGPVVAGYGTAASAFGIGATRTNGRFDQAYPLSAQALVVSWPLPDGTLLGARALSNLSDAPYVGEAALLFTLTRRPLLDVNVTEKGRLPLFVYLVLAFYVGAAFLCTRVAIALPRYWKKYNARMNLTIPHRQRSMWLTLILAGLIVVVLLYLLNSP